MSRKNNGRVSYDVKRVIGRRLSMGKAAFLTVKEYVKMANGNLSLSQLRKAFPKSANGKYEIVWDASKSHSALEYPKTYGAIVLSNGTNVLVTNQWYRTGEFENWSRFERNARRRGIEISES